MDAAVSCVGVAPQSQSAILSRSFTDTAAITRALSFSLSDTAPDPSPAPAVAFVHDAAGPGAHPSPPSFARSTSRLGPAGGGAGKRRRPRPSKRVPTTYISTDAATFRIMVQRVTGADDADEAAGPRQQDAADHLSLGLLLPHLGVVGPSSLLPLPPGHAVSAATYTSLAPAAAPEQPLFPTLDSWNVMYGKNEVA